MKATNYDATSTYPAILGCSMLWAAYICKDKKMGFWATVVSALGVLDKYTALPYWVISVVLYAFMCIEIGPAKARLRAGVRAVAVSYAGALILSAEYYFYARGFFQPLNPGIIFYSFFHALKAMSIGNLSMKIFATATEDAYIYIFELFIIMSVCAVVFYYIVAAIIRNNWSVTTLLLRIDVFVMTLGIIGGVISTYFIPAKLSPFYPIAEGYYNAASSIDPVNGATWHFGAKTAIGHFMAKLSYMAAVIITNYPTIVLIVFLLALYIVIKRRFDEQAFFASVLISVVLFLQLLYAIQEFPYVARYYSYSIFVLTLALIYLLFKYWEASDKTRALLLAMCLTYVLEMGNFIPNVRVFSPIWVWHTEEYNKDVRKGEWSAGESYFVGEHVAIAGRIIREIEGDNPDIVMLSDYGVSWLGNRCYAIHYIDKTSATLLNSNTYYVFNKFQLYRKKKPDFIDDVEPIAAIKYKGEMAAWIYRGDQLREYKEYFDNL